MKRICMLAAVLYIVLLTGCTYADYPDLPDSAIAFETGTFIDKSDDEAAYATIEYEGRTYMPYGTIAESVKGRDVERCIGYIVRDGKANTERRIYTLAADSEYNFLMERSSGTAFMDQPLFWRAVDTRGKDISIPIYIFDLGYNYWK